MTLWNSFIKYIRKKEVGYVFTRIELLDKFGGKLKKNQVTTVDNYRMLLTSCGYLKGINRGKYMKVKPVPLMTNKIATDKAYGQTWRSWFMEDVDPK